MNLNNKYSEIANATDGKAIQDLLEIISKPGIISFAGGLPSPESFPVDDLKDVCMEVMQDNPSAALQYGDALGKKELRQKIAELYRNKGVKCELENVMISSASQQSLDILTKTLVNKGDKVICGLPSYLGALDVFRAYGADLEGIPLDNKGMSATALKNKLAELSKDGNLPKFIYTIPDFQNPSGITMPESRRKEIIDIAAKYDILVIEDSPYKELRYEGEAQQFMFGLDNPGNVITLGTFSKVFVPGFRLGWVLAHPNMIKKLGIMKQNSDLCTSGFVQVITVKYLNKGLFDKNIDKIIKLYRGKQKIMLKALDEYMPEYVSWTKPEGGLFLFVNLPEHMDARELLKESIKKGVAFVTGDVFHCDGNGRNTFRINFSYTNEEQTINGVKKIAEAIEYLKENI